MENVFPLLLAHLSLQAQKVSLWYGIHMLRRPSVCQPFSNIAGTAWPVRAKFHEPLWEGGTKIYINGLGHMTKIFLPCHI